MGDVIHLNKYRKQRARLARQETAAQNRTRHGLTKEEKAAARLERVREAARLQGKLLEDKTGRETSPE